MNIKKPLIVAGAATTIGLAGLTGLGVASADTPSSNDNNIVDKIASTFNLDKSEVQAVFDENRAEHQAERQQAMQDRLDELVNQGKLTEAQKEAILTKQAEVKAQMELERESLQDLEPDEMRQHMDDRREELKAWAEENNIPTKYLRFILGGHHNAHGSHGIAHGESAPKDSIEQ